MKTSQGQYAKTMPMVNTGNFDQALLIIENSKDKFYKEKDKVLYYLDLGMLYHWAGHYRKSNELLTMAENGIEELYTRSISKALVSGVLNDNALDYSGEDYENIYLNIFKALNYIALNENEDALVEIRRIQIKLNLLEDKYKKITEEYNENQENGVEIPYVENRFYNDVLAHYLGVLLYRSEGLKDDARIDLEKMSEAWETQSQIYNFKKPSFPAVDTDKAVINIVSFNGLAPVKLAQTIYAQTVQDMILLFVTGQDDNYLTDLIGFHVLPFPGIQPNIHFKIQFPKMKRRNSLVNKVVVIIDNEEKVTVPLVEKLDNIAEETFRLKLPLIVGKTIIRAAMKNVSKEMGKQAMQQSLSSQGTAGLIIGLFAGLLADAAVDATENADLRISHFFPSEARLSEIPVEPGYHSIVVEYRNGDEVLKTVDLGEKEIYAGKLNLFESFMLQ